jgi:ABC-2 type transport system ATP-binding protein
MKRRLLIAKAMVHPPPVIVLDEPTAGVDIELRQLLWELVSELNAQGVTVVLTTHYLEEAAALADRVAVIAAGTVVAVDSPTRLTAHVDPAATVRWVEGGRERVERTEAPTELIRRLSSGHAELDRLTVTRPTLEDAYLQLIGHS